MKASPIFYISLLALFTLIGVSWFLNGSTTNDKKISIQFISIERIKQSQVRGDTVVFLDTREGGEYQEGHIDGAWNLPLREVENLTESEITTLVQADLVIPYCMKDFRGYEVARALKKHGIKDNIRLIEGYGLSAWRNR